MATASKMVVKHASKPDEVRPFAAHGHAEVHTFGRGTAMRAVFEPGWKWSKDVAPIAGTRSCQTAHRGYTLSGRMRIKADDGTEVEVVAGDFFEIPPGHDAWVVGDEPCVMLDFGGIESYAKGTTPEKKRDSAERVSAPPR
ncbi:MAG: cupin domain-containing protein [Polyangiales bacterium]